MIKAKIKAILIEYCNLEDESYSIEADQDLDLDDYLKKLESALNSWKSRVIDESKSMFTQWISELEDQKNEIENKYTEELKELNDLIESLQKENEEL